jgi:predicted nucleic acid-binding Zn ribbon protein
MGGGRRFFDVNRIETMRAALKRYLKESGVGWMLKHRDVVAIWNEAAGEAIGAETRVRSLRGGALHVEVFSPALKAELEQFGRETILRVMQERLPEGGIRRLRFHLAERPAEQPRAAGPDAAGTE